MKSSSVLLQGTRYRHANFIETSSVFLYVNNKCELTAGRVPGSR